MLAKNLLQLGYVGLLLQLGLTSHVLQVSLGMDYC